VNICAEFWSWYFKPKRFESADGGQLYRRLGVRFFKRYLPTSGDLVSGWHGILRISTKGGDLRGCLARHDSYTRRYEARHIFGGLSMLALTWWSITILGKGNWFVLLAANLFINGYPIMLQRYNRVRVQSALARLDLLSAARQASP
jgi:hypothetical protein